MITEEPYVNPTAVSRSGDYLDIDVEEDWNLDTCPYAGFDFDTSALPEGFKMNDLDFVVTYNGEVTTNLDTDCRKADLRKVWKEGTVNGKVVLIFFWNLRRDFCKQVGVGFLAPIRCV